MSTIRFIHTADLHLDSPFKGMTGLTSGRLDDLRNSTFNAFDRLIAYALQSRPDFMLIVGDIYDGEDRSLRAQLKFQKAMERLHEADIPVVITYGNHDHLSGSWTRFELPTNVHEFTEEVGEVTLSIRGQEVVLHGFSYPQRHVRHEMISRYPKAINQEQIHIGLLHGSKAGDASHAVYSPFTISELQSKHYDYWALGHIHERQHLSESPPIIYPGNIQGRHKNEQGEKGFYEVELSKSNVLLTFIPTSVIRFASLPVTISTVHHANVLVDRCVEAIEAFITENGPAIIELELNLDEESSALYEEVSDAIWLEAIRELLEDEEQFVWIQDLKSKGTKSRVTTNNILIDAVTNEMDSWSTEEWTDVLSDLYMHVRSSRYIDNQSKDHLRNLKEDANKLLLLEIASVK
ncbi:DNA repair exonuclease [Sporosarcina sp. Sa2YVA2]|uniref:DNA repair exonuclease n=1 Tax=Sporosarcina quadrami TaxID=2762234 RepID=A0ABR8UDS8_9BACL|nr:DNA repair exonuclease [Sporosarcina quadrami]MBD7985864.1 DNA repair exonuclease [Sporosarcina quadrami]